MRTKKHGTRIPIVLALMAMALLPRMARAQQDPQFTQYMFNLLAINPAYAGSAERVSLKAALSSWKVSGSAAPSCAMSMAR
jgi:hypothetical protein